MEILLFAFVGLTLSALVFGQSDEEQSDGVPESGDEIEASKEVSPLQYNVDGSLENSVVESNLADFDETRPVYSVDLTYPSLVELSTSTSLEAPNGSAGDESNSRQGKGNLDKENDWGQFANSPISEKAETADGSEYFDIDWTDDQTDERLQFQEENVLYLKLDRFLTETLGPNDEVVSLDDTDFVRCESGSRLLLEIGDDLEGFVHSVDAELNYQIEYFGESTKEVADVSRTFRFYLISDSLDAPEVNLYPEEVYDLSGELKLSRSAFSSAKLFGQLELSSVRNSEFFSIGDEDDLGDFATENDYIQSTSRVFINDWTPSEISLNRGVNSEQRVVINYSGSVLQY